MSKTDFRNCHENNPFQKTHSLSLFSDFTILECSLVFQPVALFSLPDVLSPTTQNGNSIMTSSQTVLGRYTMDKKSGYQIIKNQKELTKPNGIPPRATSHWPTRERSISVWTPDTTKHSSVLPSLSTFFSPFTTTVQKPNSKSQFL